MASVSASHLILFIASMVIAAGVAGTFTQGVSRLSQGIDDQSLEVSEEVRTDIEVISDAGSPVYDNSSNTVTILVKNTGTSTIPAESQFIEILLDGQYQTNVTMTVVDGDRWRPNNVVRLEIGGADLSSDDHRVKLIVNGDEEVFRFRS
ncbi:flagellar protein FlaG [Haloplanus vescus]|uniref:Flagellar protein FlaG n=1 Tax=Haloplanus vescus TaxID=555874 RepID=A0A1H3WBR0_9EURY|nr:flagellar protein G [Haloplanus vescus]SDZ83844.1 flagellar protein FlaG [Haloplanus vescus]